MKWKASRLCWILLVVSIAAIILAASLSAIRYFREDIAESFFDNPEKQFKYGSTGGERLVGIPDGIFRALPTLCRDYFPADGWRGLGFIFEPGMDRPIGTSKRRTLGFDRIALNCATCHVGTYRASEQDKPVVVIGMPAQRMDLGRLEKALTECALDERFNPWQVIQAAEDAGAQYSWRDRLLLEYIAVPALREGLLLIRSRLRFIDHEVESGPGRFDTFGPEKALLNWPYERLPPRQTIGVVDFPSLWLQGPREGMWLHWDGNNDSVEERNRSAAFGTGAVPTTLDGDSMRFIGEWLKSTANVPLRYPFPIDTEKAQLGKARYDQYCADCHGRSGSDFRGSRVGVVEPIEKIGTDPCRLDNYTEQLAQDQSNLYAGFPELQFSHFRKTHGYTNIPLDGIWLRGPYLHNGSVPSVRTLLDPADQRPKVFYRGNDVVDRQNLGFVSDVAQQADLQFFRYETQCVADAETCARETNPQNLYRLNACLPSKWAGNSNRGHEGESYGTLLSPAEKDALVEFLKTF